MSHPAQRHTGFELLRLLSMLMIVTMHGLGHGGLGSSVPYGSAAYCVYYLLFFLGRVSTNCFVLLTGYYMCTGTPRFSHLFRIGAQTLFYSLFTFAIAAASGVQRLTPGSLLHAVTPIFSGTYWFVSCYFLLYLSIPLLNRVLSGLDRRAHALLLCGLFVLLSVLPTVLFWSTLVSGYSLLWFFALYFLAAYLRRYPVRPSLQTCLLWYLGCSAAQVPLRCLGCFLMERFGLGPAIIDLWGGYQSPLTLFASVAFFLLFRQIELRRAPARRCVLALAPLSLGVYLLHDSDFLRAPLWATLRLTRFCGALLPSLGALAAAVLGITAVGFLVDFVYQRLYRLLGFSRLEPELDALLPRLAGWLTRRLPPDTPS